MSEVPNPAAHNQLNGLPEGPISWHMDRARQGIEHSALEPTQKAEMYADHLIGAVLRTEGVAQGATTLYDVGETAGKADVIDPDTGKKVTWARAFTRQDGLRRALADIAEGTEEGTRTLHTVMHGRLRYENPDDPSTARLTTMDQLTAYLETENPKEAQLPDAERAIAWEQTILDEVSRYLTVPGRLEAWKAQHVLGSDVESVRGAQQDWERAAKVAQSVGVDMEFVTKSAELMKDLRERGMAIGHTALVELGYDLNRGQH